MKQTFIHIFGTDNKTDKLSDRTGESVEIIRRLTDSECDPECQPMYRVRGEDGHEYDVFDEELQESRQ